MYKNETEILSVQSYIGNIDTPLKMINGLQNDSVSETQFRFGTRVCGCCRLCDIDCGSFLDEYDHWKK